MMGLMFQILRDLSVGSPRTAEQLAHDHGVSKLEVIQAMEEAKEYGIEIVATRGRGFELPRRFDWLDADRVLSALGARASQCQLRIFNEVESTNDSVLSVADRPIESGLVVVAELQTKGRGRRGRHWTSGLGSALTFSILYRLPHRNAANAAISLVVGVALMRAMVELGATGMSLKWPNDVLDARGKIGGVLAESHAERGSAGIVVIGIGLNIETQEEFMASVDQPVSDLRACGVVADRSTILGVILRHFFDAMEQFELQGFSRLRQEWTAHAAFLSKPIALLHANGDVEKGIMAGIAEDGALLLATSQGHQRVYSGDIKLRLAE